MADINATCRIGVIVPPANPAVEPEMRVLLPAAAMVHHARLPVFAETTLLERNELYLDAYPEVLGRFGSLRLDAVSIAMTGSSYSLMESGDTVMCRALSRRARAPVVTASLAILIVLRSLGARRIAMVSPYPATLTDRARAYWTASGFTVAQIHSISEEFRAYELTPDDITAAAAHVEAGAVDAVVMSGTGALTLPVLGALNAGSDAPFLPSNLCSALVMTALSQLPASDALIAALPEHAGGLDALLTAIRARTREMTGVAMTAPGR